ncbi:MAG: glycosyltransferase family 1 protein [Hyphomicrobiales bacterium]|nr:MAG: glycosyltransferase family 1 protein [Hyphomicrobiales bacterium]
MTELGFVIPGDINLPTGGYTYDRRVLELLPKYGVAARHVALPAGYPFPSPETLAESERILKSLPPDMPLLIDGLAFGAMPAEFVARIAQPIIALVHHALYLETGLTHEQQHTFHMTEKMALTFARRVIAVSPATAKTLIDDFGVAPAAITQASPGTDPAQRAAGSQGPLNIISVGSIVPRKAYDILVRALARVTSIDWRLTIAGARTLSEEANAALDRVIAETGLAHRIRLLGALPRSDLDSLYQHADLFVLASLYEGFGMVLTEALARGLPIVCTTGGAAADTVPDAAALKVAPGDVAALAAAIEKAATDADLRRRMSDAAWSAAQGLWRWQDTARTIAEAVKNTTREAP